MKHSELSRIEVSKIMQGNKNAILIHAEKRYLLSITRRGKLILTAAIEDGELLREVENNKLT